MLNRSSQALLAALAVIAAPAFAQDTATTPPPAETTETTTPAPAETDTGATEATPAESAEPAADAATTETPATEPPAADEPATGTQTDAPATDNAPADGSANTEATAPAADAATPAAPAPSAANGAPAGASDAPAAGSYYVKSSHSDWTIRCVKADQGKDPCELYQLMKDSEGNSVAEMTLIPLENGDVAAGATLVAPLETDLIEGLGFAVDGGKPRGYPFSFCAPVGCVSRMGFTTAELNALKRGNKAAVSLLPFGADPKNPVQLNLSLAGFTAGFDELATYAKAPAPAADAAPEAGDAAEEAPANN